MTMLLLPRNSGKNGPLEHVFPIEHGDFAKSCQLSGMLRVFA